MITLTQLLPALLAATPVFVSPGWVREHAGDNNFVIVHVAQNRSDYDRGHIPGAVFIDYDDIVVNGNGVRTEMPDAATLQRAFQQAGISDSSTVVFYGDPLAAARAFVTLEYIGHRKARLLNGGLQAWRRADYPLSRESTSPREGTITVRSTNFLVDADAVRAMLGKPGISLVDARPRQEYTGEDTMGGMHAAGHIPGARNLYWEKLIESREQPVTRDDTELRKLFEDAGAEPDNTVVVYCMVGLRASMAYAVARHLGYDVKFYDGSWVDWSARGFPVEK